MMFQTNILSSSADCIPNRCSNPLALWLSNQTNGYTIVWKAAKGVTTAIDNDKDDVVGYVYAYDIVSQDQENPNVPINNITIFECLQLSMEVAFKII